MSNVTFVAEWMNTVNTVNGQGCGSELDV